MSVSDIPEVQLFWDDYERALIADRRIIQTQVVRQAVEAIAVLEAEIRELQSDLERAESNANELADKISTYNPLWMMEE